MGEPDWQTGTPTAASSIPLQSLRSQLPTAAQDEQAADAADAQGFIKKWSTGLPRLRSQTSFRTRLRQARRDGGGPVVGLFEWETRGHFWSALDKAAAPVDRSQSRGGACTRLGRWRQQAVVRAKNTLQVVALRPLVLLLPLLLLGACLGLGVMGVILGAQSETRTNENRGAALASHVASSLALALGASLAPLRSLQLLAAARPAMADLGPAFPRAAAQLVAQAPSAASSLSLAPCGVVRAVYPADDPRQQQLLGTQLGVASQDLQISQLQTVHFRSGQSNSTESSSPVITALEPVLVSGVAPAETWGNDGGGDGANCSGGAWDPRDGGTKLWGFAAASLLLREVAEQPAAGLDALDELGYSYRLRVRPGASAGAPLLAELTSSPPPPSAAGSDGAATAAVPAESGAWELAVYREGGWPPSWRAPLEAVVALLSVALAGLLFAALVIRQRHSMLLGAMLPKTVVRELATGRSFYAHYDMVTVLYADIVRYSNAPTGMPPWEVVKLLNDVNNIFDALLEKHGLVKILRSGEAFMGVGGCPEAGDPISTAVRVALCAREMVLDTARYRSAAGQRVQIRLGLHSGPAVAAVVGTAQPRFSLFGDTVDIAHFMESTSSIMGVHVSDTTAELLETADDPLVMLQPRGVIDIRGRGPITTYWLRIDLLAPMATFGDRASTQMLQDANSLNLTADGGAGGAAATTGGGADGGRNGGGSGGGARQSATPAEVACTADLAVAATLGVRGAPLVRKLSRTGLARTLRTLPGRRERRRADLEAVYDRSLLGSFTARLEPETLEMVKAMLAKGDDGAGGSGFGSGGGGKAGTQGDAADGSGAGRGEGEAGNGGGDGKDGGGGAEMSAAAAAGGGAVASAEQGRRAGPKAGLPQAAKLEIEVGPSVDA